MLSILNHKSLHSFSLFTSYKTVPQLKKPSLLPHRPSKKCKAFGKDPKPVDEIDQIQQISIERVINLVQELQDKVNTLEADISHAERRDQDRMIALRSIIKEALQVPPPSNSQEEDMVLNKIQSAYDVVSTEADATWDSYRNSFTMLMSKGYLQTVDQLRDRLMSVEWELGLRPMALKMAVSRFESFCAQNNVEITFETLTHLYHDPTDLSIIQDPYLRMHARSFITQIEAEQRLACFQMCTAEAQKLAQQFSEGEFISKLLPDPIEHGVVDSLKKLAIPMGRLMSGGKA